MKMNKVHFIGIGGIGMSALAHILLSRGIKVSGSDLRPNSITERLGQKSATIYKGHSVDNLSQDIDLVVVSTCIKPGNPELVKARQMNLKVISRGALLKRLMEEASLSVAVTGTHGKTTTSGLIAHVAHGCGLEPTSVIGGELESIGGNAKNGKGELFIAELDESDGFFRNVSCTHGVITNIEKEHMEHYGSMQNLLGAFREFIGRIDRNGTFFYNGEDYHLLDMALRSGVKKVDFGIGAAHKVSCRNYICAKNIEFDLYLDGRKSVRIKSPLIGRHNLMNMLAAISVCLELGITPEDIAGSVESFRGVGRRFDRIGKVGNIEIIEDYAHHPTELSAVIRAAKDYGTGRVVSIFQPHRHSRTRDLADEFIKCFADSDILILTDVYSADEDPIEGSDIHDVYGKIDRSCFEILEFVEMNDIPEYVSGIVKEKDVVLVLGAGDIRNISGRLLDQIRKREEYNGSTDAG
ncbi:MAG: UDP-N-acetylmuramate--L-alanine ligase [Candidatus Omnitrophica bacterium]|nr:UDP-N-acetylmuramate--L-alanine ligase [Candidatus Omnitrophota bacterium]